MRRKRNLLRMSESTNEERAQWADNAIQLFARETGLDGAGEEDETKLKDLLADIRHWCDQKGLDYEQINDHSFGVHAEELAEEAIRTTSDGS